MPDTFICSKCGKPLPIDRYGGRAEGRVVCRACDPLTTPVKYDPALEWCEACAAAKEPGHAETCTREPHFPARLHPDDCVCDHGIGQHSDGRHGEEPGQCLVPDCPCACWQRAEVRP